MTSGYDSKKLTPTFVTLEWVFYLHLHIMCNKILIPPLLAWRHLWRALTSICFKPGLVRFFNGELKKKLRESLAGKNQFYGKNPQIYNWLSRCFTARGPSKVGSCKFCFIHCGSRVVFNKWPNGDRVSRTTKVTLCVSLFTLSNITTHVAYLIDVRINIFYPNCIHCWHSHTSPIFFMVISQMCSGFS